MADLDWRSWVFQTLEGATVDDAPLALLSAEDVYGAGSLVTPPEQKPFLIIRMGNEDRGPFPGVSRGRCVLWAHDEPGDYLAVDQALRAAQRALCGDGATEGQVVAAGGVGIRWMGNSEDLTDPDLGTICRNSTYDLLGRDGNG